jgi:hypothetical protein
MLRRVTIHHCFASIHRHGNTHTLSASPHVHGARAPRADKNGIFARNNLCTQSASEQFVMKVYIMPPPNGAVAYIMPRVYQRCVADRSKSNLSIRLYVLPPLKKTVRLEHF